MATLSWQLREVPGLDRFLTMGFVNEDESLTKYYPVRNVASHARCCTSVATDRTPSLGATWLTSLESSGQHHHRRLNFLLRYFQQQKMIARYTPDGIWEEVYQMEHPRAHFVAIPLPLHCNQK